MGVLLLRRYPKGALVLLALGAIIFGSSFVVVNWHKWIPASFPIDLRPGVTRSPAFHVSLENNYEIHIVVERKMPFDQLNCLLGISMGKCGDLRSPVELSWVVFSNDNVVSEGGTSAKNQGAAWGPTISRTIGTFHAEKGRDYVVEVRSHRDASVLAPAAPHIAVVVPSNAYKGYYLLAQLLGLVALVVGGIGGVWLFIWLLISVLSGAKKA